jgi:hypothetical protein
MVEPIRKVGLSKINSLGPLIFQCYAMLALLGIMNPMDLNIKKFLWQGGNSSKNKYHLINYKTTRVPKDIGDMGIKDPTLMNLEMRAKILWIIITGRLEWWKKILWKKYFRGGRNKCLENLDESQKLSQL